MKKIILVLILAALAAVGVFGQNTPWTDVVDERLVVRNQIPIQSTPVIDEKGNVSYPVSEYKLVLYYPVFMEIPGYVRTISFPKNGVFKAQVKDAKNKTSVIDLPVSSVDSVILAGLDKEESYIKIVLRIPSNYLKVYLIFNATFNPLQEGEDVETRQVLSMIGHDEKLFKQPAVVLSSKTSTGTQFVPVKPQETDNTGGLR